MSRSRSLGLLGTMAILAAVGLDGGLLNERETFPGLNPVKRKSPRELRTADDIDDRYKKQEAKLARRASRAKGGAQ